MHTLGVNEEDFDAMTMAKSFFVHRAIKSICVKEDDQVVDLFSMGYGTTEALQAWNVPLLDPLRATFYHGS